METGLIIIYLKLFDIFRILSSAFPLMVHPVISNKQRKQTIRSSFEVLQHCPQKTKGIQVFFLFYHIRRTVMAVWTRNLIVFFETDVLKILYSWWSTNSTGTAPRCGAILGNRPPWILSTTYIWRWEHLSRRVFMSVFWRTLCLAYVSNKKKPFAKADVNISAVSV